MSDSTNVTHAFDVMFSQNDAEAMNRSTFFAELASEEKAIDTFGCLGCAGTFGGTFGCLGTAGCCC
jgi:hypothetical protein